MKKRVVLFATAVVTVSAVGDLVQDFITNEPVHFFAENSGQLLWVALISIFGGLLLALCLQRRRPLPPPGGIDGWHFPP